MTADERSFMSVDNRHWSMCFSMIDSYLSFYCESTNTYIALRYEPLPLWKTKQLILIRCLSLVYSIVHTSLNTFLMILFTTKGCKVLGILGYKIWLHSSEGHWSRSVVFGHLVSHGGSPRLGDGCLQAILLLLCVPDLFLFMRTSVTLD